jgi:hypothetical protein
VGLEQYPFGHSDLLGGLRQYLGAPSLRLIGLRDLPTPQILPGSPYEQRPFVAEIELDAQQHQLALNCHEGSPVAIRREQGLYRFLAPHLPILVPGFVASDDLKGWLILENFDKLRPPEAWTVDDYREAVDNLALLHDRFWGLEEDLDTFEWLGRPLDRDFHHVETLALQALDKFYAEPHPLLDEPAVHVAFEGLVQNLGTVAGELNQQRLTLLHGEYWAGNVARPLDGRQIVTHWRHACIGPAILDVVMFRQQTRMQVKPAMPINAAIARYRAQITERQGKFIWNNRAWNRATDYALMWSFAVHWLNRLTTMPEDDYAALHETFYEVWLAPLLEAVAGHFNVSLPE